MSHLLLIDDNFRSLSVQYSFLYDGTYFGRSDFGERENPVPLLDPAQDAAACVLCCVSAVNSDAREPRNFRE